MNKMKLNQYLNEIEYWIKQVEDEKVDPEEYNFVDRVVHKGKDGNNGLGQVGAYLAVYEQDEEVQADEELIEILEERQAELPQGGRNRFSNIISEGTTKKRKNGKTIQERGIDGHQRLYNMIEAAREKMDPETEIQENHYPDGRNESTYKSSVTIQLTIGRENKMPDYNELEDLVDSANKALNQLESSYEDLPRDQMDSELDDIKDKTIIVRKYVSKAESLLDEAQSHQDELEEGVEKYEQILDGVTQALGSIAGTVDSYVDDLEEYADHQQEFIEDLTEVREALQGVPNLDYSPPSQEVQDAVDEVKDEEDFDSFMDSVERLGRRSSEEE